MTQRSGTYRGLGNDVELELRVDIDGLTPLGMLSGELNQTVELRQFNYFNLRRHSFIGDQITRREDGASLVITSPILFFGLPELRGSIEVELRPASAVARLNLSGYGYHNEPLTFALQKTSDYFRTVRLEVDREKGTKFPGAFDPREDAGGNSAPGLPNEPISIQRAFQRAGVEMIVHPEQSEVPKLDAGPDARWSTAELHAAMMNYFSKITDEPSWNVYLLVAERFQNPGVSGIMFDQTDPLPRQGAAIFYSHYRNLPGGLRQRNFLRTAVHELGHALNLMHSFQKGVFSEFGFGDNPFMLTRNDSLSFMNYSWLYPHGHNRPPGWDGTPDYWARFRFEFDREELMHLRHHERQEVILGGEAFGADGHSRVPALEPREIREANARSPIELQLRGKRVGGIEVRVFDLMEPIDLELKVQLKNGAEDKKGAEKEEIIDRLLPSEGLAAVYIRKPDGVTRRFRPLATMCADESKTVDLKPGLPVYEELPLTFGGDGFYFQEPGVYLVRAVYQGGKRLTTYSNVLAIRVASPQGNDEERLAADFFDPHKGRLLATGPSASEQFKPQIDFFREVQQTLPNRAVGRSLAAYLGVVDGLPFKDVSHEVGKERGIRLVRSSLNITKGEPETGRSYLDRALDTEIASESLGNLAYYRAGVNRAEIIAAGGNNDEAQSAIDALRDRLKFMISGNKLVRERELKKLARIEKKLIGGK